MHITNLKINHYKTVEETIELKKFSNLHILIGPNNSGKTNIMDAIEFLFSTDLDPARFYDESADLALIVETENKSKLIIKYQHNHRSYLLNNKLVAGNNSSAKEMQKRIVRIQPMFSPHLLISQELTDFNKQYPEVYRDFCATLQAYFDDVEINEKLFLENVHTDHRDRPVNRMGEGFRRLFIMLFYIFHPRFDIILIDEPELHLHPSMVRKFLKVLQDKQLNNQIFLTTHSASFVMPNYIDHLWRIARDNNNNTKIYTLTHSSAHLPKNRLVQELNADNTEMFFSDKVLLVEGVSDMILMRGLIDRFYKGDTDAKVVYTGSKCNIDIYADLCFAFNIPYTVMLDRDALTGTWSHLISKRLAGSQRMSMEQKIIILKQANIFILDGDLEQTYPKKYQRHDDTKPINALRAAAMITKADLDGRKMGVIREIISSL